MCFGIRRRCVVCGLVLYSNCASASLRDFFYQLTFHFSLFTFHFRLLSVAEASFFTSSFLLPAFHFSLFTFHFIILRVDYLYYNIQSLRLNASISWRPLFPNTFHYTRIWRCRYFSMYCHQYNWVG